MYEERVSIMRGKSKIKKGIGSALALLMIGCLGACNFSGGGYNAAGSRG
jgi:hypothetical protein